MMSIQEPITTKEKQEQNIRDFNSWIKKLMKEHDGKWNKTTNRVEFPNGTYAYFRN
jgi:hypothetical protein